MHCKHNYYRYHSYLCVHQMSLSRVLVKTFLPILKQPADVLNIFKISYQILEEVPDFSTLSGENLAIQPTVAGGSLFPLESIFPLPGTNPQANATTSNMKVHGTHHSWCTIQISCKFHFTLIYKVIMWLLQNFAHAMTAQLSWHVQNFVASYG